MRLGLTAKLFLGNVIYAFSLSKGSLTRAQMSNVVSRTCCWDCNDFYERKTKRRLNDWKTEHFKA